MDEASRHFEARRAKIEEELLMRRQYENFIQRVVELTIDTPKVNSDWLREQTAFLIPERYSDIEDERYCSLLCAYPLCSSKLTPLSQKSEQQLYKICFKSRQVFDWSQLKKFCSKQCYKASSHYKSQVPTSVPWLRTTKQRRKIIVKVNFLHEALPTNYEMRNGVSSSKTHKPISKKDNIDEITNSLSTLCNDVNPSEIHNDDEIRLNGRIVEPPAKLNEKSLIDKRELTVDNRSLSNNVSCTKVEEQHCTISAIQEKQRTTHHILIEEWFTSETYNKISTFVVGNQPKSLSSSNKDQLSTSSTKEGSETESDILEATSKHYDGEKVESLRRVSAFYSGQTTHLIRPAASEKNADVLSSSSSPKSNNDEDIRLPAIHSHSQRYIRRKLVLSQLQKFVPSIVSRLHNKKIKDSDAVTVPEIMKSIRDLVSTFNLTPTNIVWRPSEWKCLSLALVAIICNDVRSWLISDKVNIISDDEYTALSDVKTDAESQLKLICCAVQNFNF